MEVQSGAVSPIKSIEEGWGIIKNDYWTFFLMTLVAFVILIIIALIFGGINQAITFALTAAFGIAAKDAGDAGKVTAAIAPSLISMVISLFTNIIVTAVSGSLFCGIYNALARKADGGVADFGELFGGFKYFQPCLVIAVVLSALQFVLGLVTLFLGAALGVSAVGAGMLTKNGEFNPAVFGAIFGAALVLILISLVVNLVIAILTAFIYPLIAEKNLSGFQALSLSAKGGLSNFFGVLLLLILLGLMAIGGALACLVGVLFVAPILSASLFAAYRSVFGRTNNFGQRTPPPPPIFNNQPGY